MLALEMPQSPRKPFHLRPFSRKKNKDDYPQPAHASHNKVQYLTAYVHRIDHPPRPTTTTIRRSSSTTSSSSCSSAASSAPSSPTPSSTSTSTSTSISTCTTPSTKSTCTPPPSTPQRTLPTALPTYPFPPHTTTVPWDLFLPPTHTFALYTGHTPHTPSDPWFIYSQGPDAHGKLKVHFHRARAGTKVAEVFVVVDLKGEGAGKIVGIKWTRDAGMGREIGEHEAKGVVRGACKRALGVLLEGE